MQRSSQRRTNQETLDIKVIDPRVRLGAPSRLFLSRFLTFLALAIPALALAQIWHVLVCQNLGISTLGMGGLIIQGLLLLAFFGLALFSWRGQAITVGLSLLLGLLFFMLPELFGSRAVEIVANLGQQLSESALWLAHALGLLAHRPELAPSLLSPLLLVLLSILSYVLFRFSAPRLLLLAFISSFFYLGDFQEGIGRSQILLFAGLFCIGLVFLFAKHRLSERGALVQAPPLIPVALILVGVIVLYQLLPPFSLQNQKLYDRLEFIRERFKREEKLPDTINYYEFSLKDLGYYPQQNRLGGPVNILEKPYMRYEGPSQATYLAGTVFSDFQQNQWLPSSMDPNFIFRSDEPGREQRRAFFLDEQSYPTEVRQKFSDLSDATIWPLEQPVQVIFNPSRVLSLEEVIRPASSEERLRYFFNRSAQIYASMVLPETGYRLRAHFPRPLNPSELEQNLRSVLPEDLDLKPSRRYQEIMTQVDPGLAKIVYDEGGSDLDRLGRLFLARDYLSRHYQYTLQPIVPGENEDFFVHFMTTKEGYCTYFATAMTLIAREMGFKAQYVEGVLVRGVSDLGLGRYERVVKNTSAHAWTRLDLPKIGGVIIDAIPQDALAKLSRDQEREIDPPPNSEPSQTEAPPPTEPSETSEPELEESSPSESESPTPEDESSSFQMTPFIWALISLFLILLLIAALIGWRLQNSRRRHDLKYLRERYGAEESIVRIWQDMQNLFVLATAATLPVNATVLSTYRSFAQNFRSIDSRLAGAAFLAFERAFYGPEILSASDQEEIMAYYAEIEEAYKASTSSLSYFWHRVLTGRRA